MKENKDALTFKRFQKAIAKAVGKRLKEDLILPIVFPNALGITEYDFWNWKRKNGKKTKKS